jgi:hypothetical protein
VFFNRKEKKGGRIMKYFTLSYRPKPRLSARIVIRATLSLMLISGSQTTPVVAGPLENALTGPSAAGERLIMERAGLVPPREFEFTPATPLPAPLVPLVGGAPVLGADVQVNTSATGTTERTTQSETTMAVRGNTICAGYNDSGPGGFSGLARSTDLGATWTVLGGLGQSGDPVIAVHQAIGGNFYYAEIATIGGNPAIGVARSTDDCQTFGAPVNASPAASAIGTTTLNDKPWIAVDNTGGVNDGDIYVCWTRFDPNLAAGSELRFSRSTDGGATYVNEQILAPAGTAPFGCSVAVGPNGEVNVTWADRAGATINDIRFRRSVDGGVTFSPAISVSTGNRHPGIDTIVTCGAGNNRPTLTGNIRMLHQSWMAADTTGGPHNGNLYVVWATDPAGTPDNSDVMFSRSTNGGATWSAPLQLGAGGGATDQFEPFVAVGGPNVGTVTVAWYDRRNDVVNNNLIDVYKTFSRDGGVTFDPISRVTAGSFPVPPINPNFDPGVVQCYMGEYIAVASDATNFYYLWGDNRNTVVTTNFPGGRPDPDVFFEAEAIPGVNLPPEAICKNVTVNTDPGVCTAASASVDDGSFDPDGDAITLVQVPPGPYPLGPTNVTLTVTDDQGASDSCTAIVTVVDITPPLVSCVESVNPSDKNVPQAKNEDGFYKVSASDNCASPVIKIGSFTLASGETIKITQTPGKSGVRLVNTMGKAAIKHFQVGPNDAVITATDGSGNQASVTCLVPPPPK